MARRAAFLSFLAGLLVFLSVAYAMPPIDDFDPGNPFWNGLSRLCEILDAKPIDDLRILGAADPGISVLAVVGPSKGFDGYEVEAIWRFVSSGGMLLVLDDFGYANTLLEGLNLRFRFNGSLLLDPLFMERCRIAPKIIDVGMEGFEPVEGVRLNYATIIDGDSFDILAYSSSFSFLDLDYDLSWDRGEPLGPFPVAVSARMGSGSVVAVSDSSIFINSMLSYDGNYRLLDRLLSGRIVYLDLSHRTPSIHANLKYSLSIILSFLSIPESRYLALTILVYALFKVRIGFARVRSEVEELLNRHPGWDRSILERVRGDLG
ncbi:MAG: DUF4350 domain-containing protein [Candidatus Bathyarchaeia archaeon]